MQKSLYVIVLLLGTGLIAHAQVNKGNWILGGDFIFNSSTQTESAGGYHSTTTGVEIEPSLGKAVKDNFVVGFAPIFRYQQTKDNGSPSNQSSLGSYGASFFMMQYRPLGKGFSLFAGESLSGTYNQAKNQGAVSQKGYSVGLGISPGAAYRICHSVELDMKLPDVLALNFNHQKANPTSLSPTTTNSVALSSNVTSPFSSLSLGLRIYLGS